MTTHITYANGKTMPRAPHRWLAGSGPCHDCGAAEGELHKRVGCFGESCPACGELWVHCRCKTVDEIPDHGRFAWMYPWIGKIEEHEDQNGQPYTMAVEEEER